MVFHSEEFQNLHVHSIFSRTWFLQYAAYPSYANHQATYMLSPQSQDTIYFIFDLLKVDLLFHLLFFHMFLSDDIGIVEYEGLY